MRFICRAQFASFIFVVRPAKEIHVWIDNVSRPWSPPGGGARETPKSDFQNGTQNRERRRASPKAKPRPRRRRRGARASRGRERPSAHTTCGASGAEDDAARAQREGRGAEPSFYMFFSNVDRIYLSCRGDTPLRPDMREATDAQTGAPCNKGVGDVGTGPNSRTEQNRRAKTTETSLSKHGARPRGAPGPTCSESSARVGGRRGQLSAFFPTWIERAMASRSLRKEATARMEPAGRAVVVASGSLARAPTRLHAAASSSSPRPRRSLRYRLLLRGAFPA